MAYSELVKRFDLVRDYMGVFLIFGFKTRAFFDRKSGRTYDNERRRIESWLGDSLRWEYRAGGKALFLSLDAGTLSRNPLYRAWQSKSFTDNDILLHFFLLDLLADGRPRHAEAITDELLEAYDQVFEPLTVRRKLKEYAQLGILHTEKQGRRLCYTRASRSLETLFPDQTNLPELLAFFGETAPLAVVGAYLAGRLPSENLTFRFKHHFIAHTLEDQILLTALQAMRRGERLAITNVSGRNSAETVCTVIPLKILVSVQTGRRYLAARRLDARRFASFRLDYIKKAAPLPGEEGDAACKTLAEPLLAGSWGAAIPGRSRRQRFSMILAVDEEREPYILQRLRREGRGGTVEPIAPGRWRYTTQVSDTGEMMNWVKTFIGRIVALEGDGQEAIQRFHDDIRRLAEMYGGEG